MGGVFVVVVLWLFCCCCCCCFLGGGVVVLFLLLRVVFSPAGVFVICLAHSLPMPSSEVCGGGWGECGRCGILNVDVGVGVWALSWL